MPKTDETIDILQLRRRRIRHGIIGQETIDIMKRLRESGDTLTVTVDGVPVGVVYGNMSEMELANFIIAHHPEAKEMLEQSMAEQLLAKPKTIMDILDSIDDPIHFNGETLPLGDVAIQIRNYELKYDVYSEDMEEVFTHDGVLDETNPDYVRWKAMYLAYKTYTEAERSS